MENLPIINSIYVCKYSVVSLNLKEFITELCVVLLLGVKYFNPFCLTDATKDRYRISELENVFAC